MTQQLLAFYAQKMLSVEHQQKEDPLLTERTTVIGNTCGLRELVLLEAIEPVSQIIKFFSQNHCIAQTLKKFIIEGQGRNKFVW